MVFAWDDANRGHIARHGVTCDEAEQVVERARAPFPQNAGEDRLLVWGATLAGRMLQVVYVLKKQDEVDYEALAMEVWGDLGADALIVRVIHARDLMDDEKRQLTRRRR